MAFKTHSFIRGFEVAEIERRLKEEGLDSAIEATAKTMARVARNNFRAQTKGTGSGELVKTIKARKSKFKKSKAGGGGGWIYGVLGNENPPGGSSSWKESAGGRAHFFEYGRSAPGKGRGHGGPQSIRQRAQRPRPFMRPTLAQGEKKLGALSSKTFNRVIKKINKVSSSDRAKIIRRIR